MQVVINGFGRIGRSVLRAWVKGGWPDIQIVGINDIASPEMCAYLFEYDSVFGPWRGTVGLEPGALVVDGRRMALTCTPDLSTLSLSGVDLVMECTGRADSLDVASRGLAAGAARVLVSGPSQAAGVTVVLGANEGMIGKHRIVSNASCTTNALAPLVKVLHAEFGIVTGSMTTIHCYTGSQPTVDAPAADFARSRAAALSMVPTTTSAQRLLDVVLPEIAGRIEGSAVRVPVASVSAVDLCVMTARVASVHSHPPGEEVGFGYFFRKEARRTTHFDPNTALCPALPDFIFAQISSGESGHRPDGGGQPPCSAAQNRRPNRMMHKVRTEPLTPQAFAPFGDVLDAAGAPDRMINAGLCARHHDRARIDIAEGRAGISVFNADPRSLPYRFELIERHPLGSQAFLPMTAHPFLVIVAPDRNGTPGAPRAFLTDGAQGINLHRGTWHGVLTPLYAPGLFAVVDRIGEGANLQEFRYPAPWTVVNTD